MGWLRNYGSSVLFGNSVREVTKVLFGNRVIIQVGYGSYARYNGSVTLVAMFGRMVRELWKF